MLIGQTHPTERTGMHKLSFGLTALTIALIGFLLAACSHHSYIDTASGRVLAARFSKTETRKLDLQLAEEDLVQLKNRYGAIRVIEAGPSGARLTATITISATSEEEAEALLGKAKLIAERNDRGLAISTQKPWRDLEHSFSMSVSYLLEVPQATRLDIKSRNGDISVTGGFGASTIETRYGKIEVQDLAGSLDAKSNNGDITLARIRARELEAHTIYGKINVENISSRRFTLTTTNGDIDIEGAQAERIAVMSSYGTIRMAAVRGNILAKNKNGDIKIESAAYGQHELESSFGNITVHGAAGRLELTSSSGTIIVKDFLGMVDADTHRGSVELEGAFDQVRARSHNGSIMVHAVAGSTSKHDWSLSSRHGELDLRLPAGFDCFLTMKTKYGKLTSAIPMNGVRLTGEKEIKGRIGKGGGKISLETSNGRIRISEARN